MYMFCAEVIPIFLRKRKGIILNMSSATALRTVPGRAAYTASKAAVLGLTRSVALDYAKEGIRANCLCPGTVDTRSLRERVALSHDPELERQRFIERQPMRCLGTPEEVAMAALFLVSDDASFVTGAAFAVDGGMSL
jgi:NAD(P)-dependent dehydrogenase (short-subunit alcohol dehydrogenase family)